MNTHIAFLRGINVSGQKIIRMENLRKIFESMKFKNVKTYIQSGNVLFVTTETNTDSLEKKISKQLQKTFGYEVIIMVRTVSELEKIIEKNPYKKEKLSKELGLYLTFLSQKPSGDLKKLLISSADEIAQYKIIDREVFTLFSRTNAKHPFSNNFVEKILKLKATTRNWNVINEISSLAKE